MKHFILLVNLLLLCNCLFSQPNTKDYFLQKSKIQKKTAWILLGTGAGAVLIEGIADNSKGGTGQSLTGGIMTLGGIICSLTSIPFFISSSKNKRKGMALTINRNKILSPQNNFAVAINYSSISLNIALK